MKALFIAGKTIMLDVASTLFFLIIYLMTKNLVLAVILGIVLAAAQIGAEFLRRKPVGAIQYLSLVIVAISGAATLFTHNPQFILLKPSLFYLLAGAVMLKPGWMNRYLPPQAIEIVPDIGVVFGFIWACLMFVSAALNIAIALTFGIVFWASFMSIYAVASKLGLFVIQYATMRFIGMRRHARLTQSPA